MSIRTPVLFSVSGATLAALIIMADTLSGQTSVFTYQGRLTDNAAPANGTYDLQFALYGAGSGGTAVGGPLAASAVPVSNGLFTVTLDFGAAVFDGSSRYLELAVRTNGGLVAYSVLAPRQELTAVPYAIRATTAGTAGTATSAGSADSFTGALAGDVTGPQGATVVSKVGNYPAASVALGASAANAADSANTPGAIVKRDASGNFSAGALTVASIMGNGSGVTNLNYNAITNTPVIPSTNGLASIAYVTAATNGLASATALAAENSRAQTAEAALAANVASETARATAAEGTLTSNLNSETSRSQTAEATLGSNLNAEVTRATAAESALSASTAALNGTNTFTGSNTFAGVLIATNANNQLAGAFSGTLLGNVTGNLTGNADTATAATSATTATTAGTFTGPLAGDVTGTQPATVVSSVGGQTAASVATGASVANAATGANVPDTIVKRDSSGNFSAGAITAVTFAGDGSALTSLNGANINAGSVGSAQIAAAAVGTNQLAPGAAAANLQASGQSGVPSGGIVLSTNPAAVNLATAGYINAGKQVMADFWDQRQTNNSLNRPTLPASAWTGSQWLIWGGANGATLLGTGARYSPGSDSWSAITTNGAPSPRNSGAAVWTGTEMIIWGGWGGAAVGDGAKYNPATDQWTPMSTNGAPTPRYLNGGSMGAWPAVWTGTEMIVWGGEGPGGYANTGARYNPATDTWTPMSTSGAPTARNVFSIVWTGTEVLIWGGINNTLVTIFNTGAAYNPASNTWRMITTTGAPAARLWHATVWTGSEMIVWSGSGPNNTYYSDGGRYNPASDTWASIPSSGAPANRVYFAGVWSGTEMIVWGGASTVSSGTLRSDGARFNPATGVWTPTAGSSPSARESSTIAWSGGKFLLYGGDNGATGFGDLYAYTPPSSLYLYLKP